MSDDLENIECEVSQEDTHAANMELNQFEAISICALAAWTAKERNVSSQLVNGMLAQQFGVESICKLKRKHYDDVIRFLVDLDVEELLH